MTNTSTAPRAALPKGGVQRLVAAAVAAAMMLEPAVAAASIPSAVPTAAVAPGVPLALFKKKKKKKKKKKPASKPRKKKGPDLTPASAEEKRAAIREAAQGDVDGAEYASAAKTMEDNAALLGDPITYLEGADLRLRAAEKDRDVSQAEAAIESASIAADIAGFYEDVAAGSQQSAWLVIDPTTAGEVSQRASDTIGRAETLIEEIEAEQAAADATVASGPAGSKPAKKPRTPREKTPGTALLAAGSAASVVGAGGLSMALAGLIISIQKQKEVDQVVLPEGQAEVERLDEEGNRANLIAFIGTGIAVVGFGVGVPLIIVGVKRRKDAKAAPASASVQLVPRVSRTSAGLALSGRF